MNNLERIDKLISRVENLVEDIEKLRLDEIHIMVQP